MSSRFEPVTPTGKLHLLLVEDDETDRRWLRRCLSEAGVYATVDEAASAAQAMERISSNSYDCALIDYYLPDTNDVALVQDARRACEQLPIVMLTGRGDEDLAVELMKAGVGDYIPKSNITPERLASALRHAMALSQAATAQRRAEAELRARERMFHTLANAIPQLAWMADASGNRTWFNQRWLDYTGTTFGDVSGWGWQKVHDPDEVDYTLETMRHSFATGQPWEQTLRVRGKDGSYRWFLSRMVPIRAGNGEITGWVGTDTDIAEQLATEQALRDSEARLRVATAKAEAAAAARSRFLAATSHDLRQPLQLIMGTHDLLEQSIRRPKDLKTLRRGERATARLAHALDKLIEIAKLDTGVLIPRTTSFPLEPLLREIAESCKEPAEQKGLRLTIEACEEWVNSDPEMLRSILDNLVGNAIKYTDTGSVTMRCLPRGGSLTIEVHDTGIGIPADKFEAIFQEYERINASTAEGLGLGLAIVARQVELLGHRISVESQVGVGSCFRLELPRVSRRDKAPGPSASELLRTKPAESPSIEAGQGTRRASIPATRTRAHIGHQ